MTAPRTGTWKAATLLLLAAVAGGAIGSAVTARVSGHRSGGGPGHHGRDWYVDLLHRELELTAAQRDSVRLVLSRHRSAMDSMWAELRPRMDARRDAIRADIATLLTPEQRARYTELTARLDAERREKSKRDSTRQ